MPITTTINTNLQITTIINPAKIAICMQPTRMKEESDHQDEIIFPAEQAARTDFEVQAVEESNFTSVIRCSGEITASPDDQKFLSSPVGGIVIFSKKNPTEGMPVKAGETLFYISTRGLATGDAVVKARAAYEKARADYERAKILQADRIVSQKDVDAARAEFYVQRPNTSWLLKMKTEFR